MSLAEILEIGEEAGLDAGLVRQAVHELKMGIQPASRARPSALLGAPRKIELMREVSGELDDEGLERLVPMIQMATDVVGHASVIGRSLAWRTKHVETQSALSITVTSRDGRTRVVLTERYGQLAGGLFGGLIGVGGGIGFGVGKGAVYLGVLGPALFATLFAIGAIGGSYLLARSIYRSTVRSRQRRSTTLLERVASEVEGVAARQLEARLPPGLPGSSG